MTSTTRRRRGADTQRLVALYWREHGWPYATPVGAFETGADLMHTPGLSVEIKARRDFAPLQWLSQAARHPTGGLGIVVLRPDGGGPGNIGGWPVIMRHVDFLTLAEAAGLGEGRPHVGTAR